jgi:hemolysin III
VPERTRRWEELANTLTHGAGALASLAGGVVLIIMAALGGDPWVIVSVSIFVTSLIALYTASTLYHAARSRTCKARLKLLDHAAIYLLIAGTYTPFMLGALRGGWGWSLFGVVWGFAVVGIALKLAFIGRFRLVSTLVYVAMGWLILVGIIPVVRALDGVILAWLLAGGIAYTAGTPFYHSARVPYAHAIWHLFVLAGSVCHALAVASLVRGA